MSRLPAHNVAEIVEITQIVAGLTSVALLTELDLDLPTIHSLQTMPISLRVLGQSQVQNEVLPILRTEN